MQLPDYVVLNKAQAAAIIHISARSFSFPLSEEDLRDIRTLEAKYDQEGNCAGLAAPQIGISKRAIVFAAPEDPQIKRWRPDFTQPMPKTIWLNPTCQGIAEAGYHEDYEACFSVGEIAGPVKRYKKVYYQAYTLDGVLVEGEAEGFLARIIQHEIDHVNGVLFVDHVAPELLLPIEEYRRRRQAALDKVNS